MTLAEETALLNQVTVDPAIFGGKPIIRGRRLAVRNVLGMMAAGDTTDDLLAGNPWLEPDDVRACLVYDHLILAHERVEPRVLGA